MMLKFDKFVGHTARGLFILLIKSSELQSVSLVILLKSLFETYAYYKLVIILSLKAYCCESV